MLIFSIINMSNHSKLIITHRYNWYSLFIELIQKFLRFNFMVDFKYYNIWFYIFNFSYKRTVSQNTNKRRFPLKQPRPGMNMSQSEIWMPTCRQFCRSSHRSTACRRRACRFWKTIVWLFFLSYISSVEHEHILLPSEP